jgi:hypothetical protein
MITKVKFLPFLLLLAAIPAFSQVSPFMGLGNAQFFDNNGKPLVAGVLYSYQAGTTTQQATYTDATGTILNPNPIPFGSGARISIWLTSGAYYKFVLCLQNDGASCAPADVLFSVDQVPGASTGTGTAGSPFISGSANPATSGILRLASADQICWRNAAGTANLCVFKDSSDVLGWQGGAMKFPEVPCSNASLGFDYLCASSTNHRLMTAANGGSQLQLVAAGQDINTSDFVTGLHFGATATPLGSTAPTTGQYLQWNGTNWIPASLISQTLYLTSNYTNSSNTFTNIPGFSFAAAANQNYKLVCDIDFNVTNSPASMFLKVTGPASPTALVYDFNDPWVGTTANVSTIFGNNMTSGLISNPGANYQGRLTLSLINGPNSGTVQLQGAYPAGAGGTFTILAPSSCLLTQ